MESKVHYYSGFKICRMLHTTQRNDIKFIYSDKATKFCEISTLLLSYVVPVKSKVEISQNFAAFSEYMNFNREYIDFEGVFTFFYCCVLTKYLLNLILCMTVTNRT